MNRRNLLGSVGSLGVGLILNGCTDENRSSSAKKPFSPIQNEKATEGEVTAVEDLMREHGVLRRMLFVYSETAVKLRSNPGAVDLNALQKTAKLFRNFGEDYHEKKLEEVYIFPMVKSAGSRAAMYPDILIAQHNRGREITDYILTVTRRRELSADDFVQLAGVMESMVRMYRAHAAREDTAVFPAWKQTLTAKQLDEMNDKFEDIEHQQFGEDGFEKAVGQISDIENELGLSDLGQFTAAPI